MAADYEREERDPDGGVLPTKPMDDRAATAAQNHGTTTTMKPTTHDSNLNLPTLRRALVGLALPGLLGLLGGAAQAAPPDLAPISVVGPGTTYTDAATLATVNVGSFGDPLVGTYLLEILISADTAVDGSDPVVASVVTGATGSINVPVTLPPTVPTGLVHWAARISGVADEVATANNAAVGTAVMVQSLDLAIVDGGPIQFFVRPTDVTLLAADVVVQNLGSPQSVLVFSVDALAPAPWLEITPPSSFAVGGEPAQPIQLKANYVGLVPGTYTTTLRFQSYSHAADFEDVPVTLEVGDPKFIAGDRLVGQIAVPGDADELKFDGVKGMKLRLRIGVKSGDLTPRIEVIDPQGGVEKVLDFAAKAKGIEKIAKLKGTGEYSIRVVGQTGAQTGAYWLKTGRKLPKAALARIKKVTDPGSGIAEVEVRLLPKATLDFAVDPNASFAGTVALGFSTSTGTALDILANTLPGSGDEIRVEDVEIATVGDYRIDVAGFGPSPKAKAKVHIAPVQPKKGAAKVYVP